MTYQWSMHRANFRFKKLCYVDHTFNCVRHTTSLHSKRKLSIIISLIMNFTSSSTISKLLFECEEKKYRHHHHRGAVCVSHMWDSCTIVITPLHGTLMLYMYRQKRENLENSLPQLYLLWHANQKPPSTTCVHGGCPHRCYSI